MSSQVLCAYFMWIRKSRFYFGSLHSKKTTVNFLEQWKVAVLWFYLLNKLASMVGITGVRETIALFYLFSVAKRRSWISL